MKLNLFLSQFSQFLLARSSFFYYKINSIMISSDALLHCFLKWFIDLTYLNYMSLIFFLSFSHISIYPHLFFFSILLYDLESGSFFMQKIVSCYKDMTDISYFD
jgi:hypothetical protein